MPPTKPVDTPETQREVNWPQSSGIGFGRGAGQRFPDGCPRDGRFMEDRRYREPDVHPRRAHVIRHRQLSPENLSRRIQGCEIVPGAERQIEEDRIER